MIVIGEKLNSSIPGTLKAMQDRDEETILTLIKNQADAGADYIDINTAVLCEDETDVMKKIIRMVKETTDCGIMIDSPDFSVIQACLPETDRRKVIVNSINADSNVKDAVKLLKEYNAKIICLPISGGVISRDPEERFVCAERMVNTLEAEGISRSDIFMDILIQSAATDGDAAKISLETLRKIKTGIEGINTVCGLSNVSFGLPKRANMNAAFLIMAQAGGLDAAILDPTSDSIKKALVTSDALLGRDEYCLEYINYARTL